MKLKKPPVVSSKAAVYLTRLELGVVSEALEYWIERPELHASSLDAIVTRWALKEIMSVIREVDRADCDYRKVKKPRKSL